MTEDRHDAAARRAELLGAALGGDLTAEERAELGRLAREDPTATAELDAAAAVVHRLADAPLSRGWDDAAPPPGLADRVLAATSGAASGAASGAQRPAVAVPAPRRGLGAALRALAPAPLLVAASALLLLGGLAGYGVDSLLERPPTGPAGTLGAVEEIRFTGVPEGVGVSAAVVAHSWGTETVFDEITGLAEGETYRVVLVADDGSEVVAGSFQAVAGAVDCRMTAATMRAEVGVVTVRAADGTEVMSSALPPVADA